jgi:DNA polymerase III epsilon subunit-like protein
MVLRWLRAQKPLPVRASHERVGSDELPLEARTLVPEIERPCNILRAPRQTSDAALSSGKREIVLDIKTTGANLQDGHRLISVGCVERVNHIPSGYTFRAYCNPERGLPTEAVAVHGLSEAFLKDKPFFAEIADDLITFLGDATLVIDGGLVAFGSGFLNAELERAGRSPIACERFVEGGLPF